jgi:UPF0755 protein
MQRFLLGIWLLIVLGIAFFLFLLTPATSESNYVPIEIAAGSSFQDIAKILSEKDIIRSKHVFTVYSVLSGSAHQLKPGNYLLNSASSTPAIINAFLQGPIIDKKITIPEGATLKDIDVMLANAGILPAGSFINFSIKAIASKYEFLKDARSLEGFLFPDTYRFFKNSTTQTVVIKMLDNFEKKALPIISNFQFPISNEISNIHQLLIIASLLEKEASDFNERQLIAGILYKRLQIGMGLQVDAAITYAKCGGAFLTCDDPKVYRKDLEFQSPYNTYLYNGLPPTPIGNPGLEAIKAALNPIESEYLYYLSDPKTKKTIFSKTLEGHNENRAKYLGT